MSETSQEPLSQAHPSCQPTNGKLSKQQLFETSKFVVHNKVAENGALGHIQQIIACRPSWGLPRFLDSLQTKNGFYICKWLKKFPQIIFHDIRVWHSNFIVHK